MMNREKFMKILRSELRKLPEEERNAALEYYEEYFDEAGPENEQQVIEELGNPKKLAAQIKSEYAMNQLDNEEIPTAKKGWSAFKWSIVGICSAPISIPVIILLIAAAIAAFGVFICCVVGVLAGIAAAAAGSIALLVIGILAFPAVVSTAFMLLGIGLAGLGASVLLGWLAIWAIKAIIAASVRAVKRSNEKRKAKKNGGMKEEPVWTYRKEA